MKDKISFSSMIEGTMFHTFISLDTGEMTIRKNVKTVEITDEGKLTQKEKNNSKEEVLFFGTIAEFKALEGTKSSVRDRVYESILSMAEHLIEAFSKA